MSTRSTYAAPPSASTQVHAPGPVRSDPHPSGRHPYPLGPHPSGPHHSAPLRPGPARSGQVRRQTPARVGPAHPGAPPPRRGRVRIRVAAIAATAAASAAVAVVAVAAVMSAHSSTHHAVALKWSNATAAVNQASATSMVIAGGNVGWRMGLPARSAASQPALSAASTSPAAGSLVLTARDYASCPAPATACVDLARHLTWLQSGGRVIFGPVRMEPGRPGSAHPTPRGTFAVSWKAGPTYRSTIYGDPMPWAVFFAPGGIAFHGGSLTTPSHGCVHLTVANAHYYNEHLPVGAEVIVF